MAENVIEVVSLEKSYGKNQVLKGISLSVKRGQVFGILGVNGAGKTTFLEIVEGLRSYQKGEVVLFGENIAGLNGKRTLCQKIGVQLQLASFPKLMKVKEIAEIVYAENKIKYTESGLEDLGLLPHSHKKYGELSTGLKRRLHLMLALVNDPEIIILDEPTAGLDLQGRAELHGAILRLKKQGKTIILSSHDSAEIENLCDGIGIIKDGQLEYYESIEAFKIKNGIGLIAKGKNVVMVIGQLCFFIIVFLGGIMFPAPFLPDELQKVAGVIPASMVIGIRDGVGDNGFLKLIISAVIALVIYLIIYRVKINSDKQ